MTTMQRRYWDGRVWEVTRSFGSDDVQLVCVTDGESIVRSRKWMSLWTAPLLVTA